MGDLLQPTHLMIIAIVVLVLFGGRKLPELGKGLGEGLRGFRDGMKGVTDDVNKTADAAKTATKPEETTK
jgi:sec-independent protein translocase protein TatA